MATDLLDPADADADADAPEATDRLAQDLFDEAARAASESPPRRPGATYRLQLHKQFRLEDVTRLVDYLDDLGITDVYLSPFLEAKPGSTHGYDVFDHGKINPEIGDARVHDDLIRTLAARGMGRLLDIVPNHMGVAGPNRFWLEMLEAGPQSPSARFFDIDWHPVKDELDRRVLLPILEDQYGVVLEQGLLKLIREGGSLLIDYRGNKLPLAPRSYATVLASRTEHLLRDFDPADPFVMEYRSIWDSARKLAPRDGDDPIAVERALSEKEVIKRRLRRLANESPELGAFLDASIAAFAGTPGDPRSFDALHGLLEEQVYRLAYWRVAAEEINYRRFFDINDLAGLRTEDPAVFAVVHDLIFHWIDLGGVTGLRVDHPDGLADPAGYFRRLQETNFLDDCLRRLEARGEADLWPKVEDGLRELFRRALDEDPASALSRSLPVVIEKILSRGEDLHTDWPVDGTVGYEYLNALNGLFVDPNGSAAIDEIYAEFTGDREPFAEVVYDAKRLICRASLSSEINMLARQLNRISEADLRSRDFTLNDLRRALIEVISCFPVYRTYVEPDRPVAPRDRAYIEQAVARARRRNLTTDASVFDFLGRALLLEHPEGIAPEAREAREQFVRRFQQTTGPVQAKGLEDTSFYRQVKLLALNEVGGDPTRFGTSPSVFHALNSQRLALWPGGLSTTATHDTKRGEDARTRIDVLSEIPDEWRTHLRRWTQWNARKRTDRDGQLAPDPREEFLIYQSLIGAWPTGGPDDAPPRGFLGRMQEYINKAVREAKLNTSWTDQDPGYVEALRKFLAEILEGPDAEVFLRDFLPFQRRVARVGVVNSLAQLLLKVASPGVPDIYQGCDLWDFSLVDPDNRRPVDYKRRRELLGTIRDRLAAETSRADFARELFAAPDDGAIKLYLVATLLDVRRGHDALFRLGAYRPLEADGERKANVVAFARTDGATTALAVAPRLVAPLMGEDGKIPPTGDAWGDARLLLPDSGPSTYREVLTDRPIAVEDREGRSLLLAEIFATLPVALLIGET